MEVIGLVWFEGLERETCLEREREREREGGKECPRIRG